MPEQESKFDQWGVVEVMGHKKFAGHITEQVIAGSALVRVDVPEVVVVDYNRVERSFAPFTKLIGVSSVYAITPTTEEIARAMATQIAKYDGDPLPVRIPAERQLPASTDDDAVVVGAGRDDDDDAWDGYSERMG
jgi:hypothetical protein